MTREPLKVEVDACPVCGEPSRHAYSAPNWGEMRSCLKCGLIFAQPMALAVPPAELYSGAYSGRVPVSGMTEFNKRLMLANSLHGTPIPSLALWSSAYQESLKFLKKRFAKGTQILDIGCGTGLFLKALQAGGFEAVGCDVASPVVEFLRSQGFTVYQGSVHDCSFEGLKPAAVTSFFVLHHIADPIGFLSTILLKFPQSTLVISEYYDLGVDLTSPNSLPPRTLSLWTPEALRLALKKAGYSRVSVMPTKFAASEVSVPGAQGTYTRLRNVIPSHLLPLYFQAKKIVFWPLALHWRIRGRCTSILGIAEP